MVSGRAKIAAAAEAIILMPQLYQKLMDEIAEKRQAAGDKAYLDLTIELDNNRRAVAQSNELEWAEEEKERLERPVREKAAFDTEMAVLAQHLEQIQKSHQTAAERIEAQYAADVAKFTAAEEKKALAAATSDGQRTQIAKQYEAIREALDGKEQQDLQVLQNSTGWQGVFGSKFAQLIRGNEALSREWANVHQSVADDGAGDDGGAEGIGRQTFEQLAQGMGSNIANAIVYSKSIGEAMRERGGVDFARAWRRSPRTWAIYSAALGFTRLAQHDPGGRECGVHGGGDLGICGRGGGGGWEVYSAFTDDGCCVDGRGRKPGVQFGGGRVWGLYKRKSGTFADDYRARAYIRECGRRDRRDQRGGFGPEENFDGHEYDFRPGGDSMTKEDTTDADRFRDRFRELERLCRERKQKLDLDFNDLLDQAVLGAIGNGWPQEEYAALVLAAASRALEVLIKALVELPAEVPLEDARTARAVREFAQLVTPQQGRTN